MLRFPSVSAALFGGWLILFGQTAGPKPVDAATAALAQRLDAALSNQERDSLLSTSPELVTDDLIRACLDRGQSFGAKFDYDAAKTSYQSALAASRKLGDRGGAARAWRGIALSESRQGRYTEALQFYRLAVEEAHATKDRKLQAEMLRSVGLALRYLGDFAAALANDEQTLAIYQEIDDSAGIIATLNGMGNSYARLGDLHKAAELFERCVKLGEAVSRPEAVYKSIENLGSLYFAQGDSALTLTYYERALALKRAAGAPKNEMAVSYVNLIPVYRSNGRYQDALLAAAEALKLSRETNDEPNAAYALLNRAEVHRKLHRNQDALTDLHASLEIYQKNKSQLEIASTEASIADVQLDLAQNQAALDSSLRSAELARRISAPDVLWQALRNQGHAFGRLSQPKKARDAYQEGILVVDEMRKQLAGGEQQGLDFLRDKMDLFHGLMALELKAGEMEPALRVAERAKAGLILDVLRTGHARITKTMTPAEKAREQQLSARVAALRAQKRRDPAALEKAVSELGAFHGELYAAHPELRTHRGESEPLALPTAKALLPDRQTALIEYAVAPDATYLFLITLDAAGNPAIETHQLDWKQEALAQEVEDFRRELSSRSLNYRERARTLYRRLLGPASASLKNKTLVCIVPDGPLWSLPFQALVTPANRHLIEDVAVFYASSLTVLLESTRMRRPQQGVSGKLLAMGDPQLGTAQGGLPRLPNAGHEVDALGRLYGPGAVALTGSDASEARWKVLAPKYGVLHLATHGNLNSSNPLFSNMVLAAGGGEDGLVEAREILDLDLSANLVVLSGCETGRGGFHYGEGLVGLSWALMVAGSPSSLVSQWKVDSAGTTQLMLAFHSGLRARAASPAPGKAAAFRSAALVQLRSDAYRHPYYWAGFTLIGDGY